MIDHEGRGLAMSHVHVLYVARPGIRSNRVGLRGLCVTLLSHLPSNPTLPTYLYYPPYPTYLPTYLPTYPPTYHSITTYPTTLPLP